LPPPTQVREAQAPSAQTEGTTVTGDVEVSPEVLKARLATLDRVGAEVGKLLTQLELTDAQAADNFSAITRREMGMYLSAPPAPAAMPLSVS
jgi:hypothetical protein